MTRALLKQALDALETVSAIDMWAGVIPNTNDRVDDAKYKATKAIEALRAELVKPAQEPLPKLAELISAAQGVIEWVEASHRPPVRDKLEGGLMVLVRLHALADLHDALKANGLGTMHDAHGIGGKA